MKIILIRAVEGLGKPFDVITVKDGYARNYLFPKNLALPATKANLKGLEKNKKRFSKTIERLRQLHMGLAERLASTTINTSIKTGIEGKAFGSITSQDIVDLLQGEGIELDKKQILLDEPIKGPGIYNIKVHLGKEMDAQVKVDVKPEGE